MGVLRAVLSVVALFVFSSGLAEARCTGKDLFAELQKNEPEAARAVLAEADAVPNGQGRFWKVERPGTAPSYLFGTFHVADAVEGVPDDVWLALDQARIAVFEVTLSDEESLEGRMASDPSFVLDQDARPFSERMSGADLERVEAAFASRGIAVSVAEKLQPWMQISLITFPPCQLRQVERGAKMLDVVLAERAVAKGIPEKGLERAVEALESLSRLSVDDQTRLIIAAGRSADIDEDLFITNLALYHRGQIALIERFNDWVAQRYMPDLDLPAVNKRLLTDLLDGRNANWMPILLPEIERGNAFVAVGALHLVGEAGLVALLKRAGYSLTLVH